jgi:hypothetical protein
MFVLRGYNVLQGRWGLQEIKPEECMDCETDSRMQVSELIPGSIGLIQGVSQPESTIATSGDRLLHHQGSLSGSADDPRPMGQAGTFSSENT